MPTRDENLEQLRRTPGDLARVIEGVSEAALTRRPAPAAWAAREILCHLRDTEDAFGARYVLALENDTPRFPPGTDADRVAEERQYLRMDGREALAAFARKRAEMLAVLEGLGPEQWRRSGVHPKRGPMSLAEMLAIHAGHDGNHLDQLRRALRGEA